MNERVERDETASRDKGLLICLLLVAVFLVTRLCWFYLADAQRFPINTVKIAASYQHISHKELQDVLANHLQGSFFSLSVRRLQQAFQTMEWIDKVVVKKIWPDALNITIIEKKPIAFFGDALMTKQGQLFRQQRSQIDMKLPQLNGPLKQKTEVLQVYQKLSNILQDYDLSLARLNLGNNQAWEMTLVNGVEIHLGKQGIEQRLKRFCKAYPALIAEKGELPVRVDLRYPYAMAIKWTH